MRIGMCIELIFQTRRLPIYLGLSRFVIIPSPAPKSLPLMFPSGLPHSHLRQFIFLTKINAVTSSADAVGEFSSVIHWSPNGESQLSKLVDPGAAIFARPQM